MRMRLKKHLEERIADCQNILLVREGDNFFRLTEQQKMEFMRTPQQIFGNDNPLYLELGCGKGTFAIKSAEQNADVNYIALEKLSNVIVVGCEDAIACGVTKNLRFLNIRAENLHYHLPQHSVERIYLNFSCPFPKKTYANRRLTSKNFLNMYRGLLTENGEIWQKTDNKTFFEYSIESLTENGYQVFDINTDLPADFEGNVVTEYESKFRALGQPIYALKAKLVK